MNTELDRQNGENPESSHAQRSLEPCEREALQRAVRWCRFRAALAVAGILGFVGSVAAMKYLTPPIPVSAILWLATGTALSCIAFAFAMVIAVRGPNLVCPVCDEKLERVVDRYCPECGAVRVRRNNRPRSGACESCGVLLMTNSWRERLRRPFKIRVCTYCGVLLDENGL
jgi:predicted RNA-binding Zn-ribbon protein involved in translation (DUF1610 family)